MSNIDQTAAIPPSSLFRLFLPEHLPATLMLAGGVTLYAVESYIMATIAPSIVRDIGGLVLFSWVTSLFVAAAVLGSIFVAMRPRGIGLRSVYVIAALVFGVGSLIAAAAPSMPVVLIGRTVQGLGTGALAALGYAFIRFVYPEPLWPKASTLYAAIWGVSTVIGPTLGGFFSAGHAWRYAFIVLVPLGLLMAVLAPRLLPDVEDDREQAKTPVAQIGLLLAAVLMVSAAGAIEATATKVALIAASVVAVAGMIVIEGRSPNRLLPSGAVSLSQPISRVYLAMLAMTVVLVSDVFIPYFLQTLHGVPAIVSGYLVALVALGWTFAAFLSGSWAGGRAYWAIVIGALIEAAATASLALFLAKDNPQGHMLIIGPAAVGMFMMGFGIGLGWAHLVAMVLKLVADNEQDKASAAIPTMSSLGGAFGAAFSGVIANGAGLVDPGGVAGSISAAHWLYVAMALPGILAVGISLTLSRRAA
ncbi:MFS transporter [Rhizobium leguminosarum]|uniref:MFS transporter n=1 Tax=Rhizobium leguminosarum TaxID=384 RepID=UPI001A91241A|nr:MFS transporter [Rhizobium leguminosarum]MBY5558230.1 MFS transporter [Rhizobium leguminosarum]MBY5634967.1 MFS transporter [Rhizobium leguminosarum]MBY5648333.1 MFS transporter [Rhizobium leguminosarum]MBY5688576.1 MFS transporter [Rhizobium leguminosarum]MBY5728145.1 MFS transporter [Rhizobium leguminosarum]